MSTFCDLASELSHRLSRVRPDVEANCQTEPHALSAQAVSLVPWALAPHGACYGQMDTVLSLAQ